MATHGRPPEHWVKIEPAREEGTNCWRAKCLCGEKASYVKKSAAQGWANQHEDEAYKRRMDGLRRR